MRYRRIGVIGGGASGMMAALTAAGQGAEVTLLEGGERVGKKILSTGNGKCNLGNLKLDAEEYCGASKEWTERCLRQFDAMDCVDFFRGIGLLIKNRNGYLYPACEQAAVVLDALRTELRVSGVRVITDCKVEEIHKNEQGGFDVAAGKEVYTFERVILACGGKAAPKTGSDGSGYQLARSLGHTIIPVVPALVQLRCSETYLKEVAGVRADACIRVVGCAGENADAVMSEDIAEFGELQLTDYGISGIPVFQMSRKVNYLLRGQGKGSGVEVSVDFLPDYQEEEFSLLVVSRRLMQTERTAEEFMTGLLHKKLVKLFLKLSGIRADQPMEDVPEEKLAAFFALCKDWRLHVVGSNSFDSAQVCAGGVDTKEVAENMESRLVPGLFFAGELLDVDGRCGGYNLHFAWCSGYIAGRAAARM